MNMIEELEKAVLTELFRRFPGKFCWIGGSLLHLVHHSPRASLDLDLAPHDPPAPEEILEAVRQAVAAANAILQTNYAISDSSNEAGLQRIRIAESASPRVAFSVDITRIAGAAIQERTILLASVLGTASVQAAEDTALLFQKLRALILRRYAKPGDLFDAWFLLQKGVRLNSPQAAILRDEGEGATADSILARFAPERGESWFAPLRRAGVEGLNAQTAHSMVHTVHRYLHEVLT